MSRDWKKYGSPYDPGYQGKMQKPKTAEELRREEREREMHQLRGCGDPYCAMCNPETAYSGTVTGRTSSRNVTGFSNLDFNSIRALEDLVMGGGRGPRIPVTPKGPPKSYTDARAKVEEWLIEAPEQAFTDIVGNEEALGQLSDAIQAPVTHKELYEAYGMKMPRGALLSGPPGCGKTMFARAAASEMKKLYGQAELVSISGSALQSMFVGETEGRIRDIFSYAREFKAYHGSPLLVFIDEAEVLFPDRTGRIRRVASWEESQVATFLAEMDGMQETGAFVLLATNRPEVIDQAVLRDGRCDFKIVVKRPTYDAVEVILRNNFQNTLVKENTIEELVFAALESLFDPHKVIVEAQAIKVDFEKRNVEARGVRHFLLEHIISGAMAAGIPARATRRAFARDKADGVIRGVTVADVVQAVNDVFFENKDLDHAFAFEEFRQAYIKEAQEQDK